MQKLSDALRANGWLLYTNLLRTQRGADPDDRRNALMH